MENKIQLVWTREDFERVTERPLTDKEWEVLASEVEGDTEEIWFAHIVKAKFDVIEHLVEQDSKYDE